ISSFNLYAYPSGIAHQPDDLSSCGSGNTTQDLTLTIPQVLASQNPDDFDVLFFLTETEAEAGNNPILNPDNDTPDNTNQTIWVRIQNAAHPDCYNLTNFQLVTTSVEIGEVDDLTNCGAGGATATFDLTSLNEQALNGQSPSAYEVEYY